LFYHTLKAADAKFLVGTSPPAPASAAWEEVNLSRSRGLEEEVLIERDGRAVIFFMPLPGGQNTAASSACPNARANIRADLRKTVPKQRG